MRNIVTVVLFLQLAFVITFAQITFTREWVTGKRSPPSSQMMQKESKCISFVPAIEYLMETERMRKKECGPYLRASQLPWRPSEDFPKSASGVKGEESLQYEPDFNPKLSGGLA